jgi:hypothetical protein
MVRSKGLHFYYDFYRRYVLENGCPWRMFENEIESNLKDDDPIDYLLCWGIW